MRRKIGCGCAIVVVLFLVSYSSYWGYTRWNENRIRKFREECLQHQSTSDWPHMEEVARRWTAIDPHTADPWLFLAIAIQEQGDLKASAAVLNQLPDKDPKTIPGLLELSALQFGPLNKPLDGVATCQRILNINPRILEARRRVIFFNAICLQRTKMTTQIYESIEFACEPRESYVYLMLGDAPIFSNGFQTANHWLQNEPDSELFLVARTVQLAENLAILKEPTTESKAQLDRAEQILTDYGHQFPGNTVVLWYFLKSAIRRSDIEEVGKLLAKVPQDAGDESVFWRYRGWYHAQVGEIEEAEAAYVKSASLTPLDAQVWHELADVLRRRGKLTEADNLQHIAANGRQLRLELQKLKDAATVSDLQLESIRQYAQACGDHAVADALRKRLKIKL